MHPVKISFVASHSKNLKKTSQQLLQDSTFGRTAWSRTTWGHPKFWCKNHTNRVMWVKDKEPKEDIRRHEPKFVGKCWFGRFWLWRTQRLSCRLATSLKTHQKSGFSVSRFWPPLKGVDYWCHVLFAKSLTSWGGKKHQQKKDVFFLVRYEGGLVVNSLRVYPQGSDWKEYLVATTDG